MLPSGVTLTFSGSGITASNGDTLSFVHDQAGRLTQVIAPDGTRVIYSYDDAGNLVSGPQPDPWRVGPLRLQPGHTPARPGRLAPGWSKRGNRLCTPRRSILPLTADLGGAGQFLTSTQTGALAAGGTEHLLVQLPAHGARVDQQRRRLPGRGGSSRRGQQPSTGGAADRRFDPGIHQHRAGQHLALFDITHAGLELLSITGANSTTSSGFTLQLFVAGDVNRDGTVDATDSQLLMAAMGSSVGQPNYLAAADFLDSGTVSATDAELLASDLGFAAAQPPVVTNGQAMTHQDLAASVDLGTLATDASGNTLYYRIVSARTARPRSTPTARR